MSRHWPLLRPRLHFGDLFNTNAIPVLLYKAQLTALPQHFAQVVRTGINTVLHIATNAFSHLALHTLYEVGGPKVTDAGAAARAALFRTAAKTCPTWPIWVRQLRESASNRCSLGVLGAAGVSLPFWDTQPFALQLEDAWLGFPSDKVWAPGGARLLTHMQQLFVDTQHTPQRGQPKPGNLPIKSIQKLAYACLVHRQSSERSDIFEIVSRRIAKWLGYNPTEFVLSQFILATSLLRKMRCHEAMQIVKTWTNSWATSVRYHESIIFPCLLGCQDSDRYYGMIQCPLHHPTNGAPPLDDFSHYLYCPNMWRVLDSIVSHSIPIDPLKRLGLIDSNFENLFTLACSFHAYHSIKQVRNNLPTSLDFSENIRRFSEAFITVAHDVGLQHSRVAVDASTYH